MSFSNKNIWSFIGEWKSHSKFLTELISLGNGSNQEVAGWLPLETVLWIYQTFLQIPKELTYYFVEIRLSIDHLFWKTSQLYAENSFSGTKINIGAGEGIWWTIVGKRETHISYDGYFQFLVPIQPVSYSCHESRYNPGRNYYIPSNYNI